MHTVWKEMAEESGQLALVIKTLQSIPEADMNGIPSQPANHMYPAYTLKKLADDTEIVLPPREIATTTSCSHAGKKPLVFVASPGRPPKNSVTKEPVVAIHAYLYFYEDGVTLKPGVDPAMMPLTLRDPRRTHLLILMFRWCQVYTKEADSASDSNRGSLVAVLCLISREGLPIAVVDRRHDGGVAVILEAILGGRQRCEFDEVPLVLLFLVGGGRGVILSPKRLQQPLCAYDLVFGISALAMVLKTVRRDVTSDLENGRTVLRPHVSDLRIPSPLYLLNLGGGELWTRRRSPDSSSRVPRTLEGHKARRNVSLSK
ncbi:hypothetical protein F5Y18DRAFT_426093 [Xylariaceae sp. FL1019]|nr:hypothetical protein F5Y18DRAFT_426093 [Xylariaceae sp. FL1019]